MLENTRSHHYHPINPTSRQSLMFQEIGFDSRTGMTPDDGVEEEACTCDWVQAIGATRQRYQPTLVVPTMTPEPEEEAYSCPWIQAIGAALGQHCRLPQWMISSVLSPPSLTTDRTEASECRAQQNSVSTRTLSPEHEDPVRTYRRPDQGTSFRYRTLLPDRHVNTTLQSNRPENSCRSTVVNQRSDNQNDHETLLNHSNTLIRPLENHPPILITTRSYSEPIVSRIVSPCATSELPTLATSNRSFGELTIFNDCQWSELSREQNSGRYLNFLEFLQRLALHHRDQPQEKLVDRLEMVYNTVKKDRQLWDEVLMEAEEGSSTCQDRALHYFRSIESRCLIYRLLNGQPVDDKKMFEIMRSLYRREKLQEKVTQLIAQQGNRVLPVNRQFQAPVDEIEIQLYFETKLNDLLGLLGEKPHMRFRDLGKVQVQFLEQVADELLNDEQIEPSTLTDYIANNSYWKEYVNKKFCDELANISAQNGELMEQLEEKLETGNLSSQEYLEKSDELMKNYHKACDNTVNQGSQTILQQHCSSASY